MTDGVYTFDAQAWALRYPELAQWTPNPQMYFDEATMYLDNSPCSVVRNVVKRGIILGAITAHIAAMNAMINCQMPSTLVGRISNATEGSVSVATALVVPMSAEWFSQTRYGFSAWQMMAQYRTARYIPAPCSANPLNGVNLLGGYGGYGGFGTLR